MRPNNPGLKYSSYLQERTHVSPEQSAGVFICWFVLDDSKKNAVDLSALEALHGDHGTS